MLTLTFVALLFAGLIVVNSFRMAFFFSLFLSLTKINK